MRRIVCLLVSLAGIAASHAAEKKAGFELALVDMQGNKKVLGTLPDTAFAPRVSPDGTRLAWEQKDPPAEPGAPELVKIHVGELQHPDKNKGLQQTVTSRQNWASVWSPDGTKVAFLASGNSTDALFWERSDGGIQPLFLIDGRAPEDWYDHEHLTFLTLTGNRDYGISVLDLATLKTKVLVDVKGSEQHSSNVSPDGHWLAYASNETGRLEVWLEPLPQTGKRAQLTKNGGQHPEWSPDGKTIYFDQGGQIYRMDVTAGADPKAGTPVALPIKGFVQGDLRRQYDLTPDGKGFVMLFTAGG